jgi:hypothetical protein
MNMRAQYTQCQVCLEYFHVSEIISHVPICGACQADILVPDRLQKRIVHLYEELIKSIESLSDTDSERYHNVWVAQLELARPPRYLSRHDDDIRAENNRRDLLHKKVRATLMKNDAVSACMKIAKDLKATLDIQRCVLLADYERSN